MEFFDVLKARHSGRAYADTPVEDEKLEQILEAMSLALNPGSPMLTIMKAK